VLSTGAKAIFGTRRSNYDTLDLIKGDRVVGAVVEFGGARLSCAALNWAFSTARRYFLSNDM
jgi:hypothetical protein